MDWISSPAQNRAILKIAISPLPHNKFLLLQFIAPVHIQIYYNIAHLKKQNSGTSLVVQRLRLSAPTAGGVGSISGWGTKIPHASRCGQKVKKKKNSPVAAGTLSKSLASLSQTQ